MKKLILIFLLLAPGLTLFAQEQDTTSAAPEAPEEKRIRDPRPRRATIMSAVVPGLGQIYNKSYWKLPILYGGEAVLIYFIINNHKEYKRFWLAHTLRTDGIPYTLEDQEFKNADDSQLKLGRDYYRRNRDLSVVFALLLYGINILDANVDAHLKSFEVSDDLSLEINPFYYQYNKSNFASGLTLSFKLK